MNRSTTTVETVLAQAVEITAPEQRQAFVEQACGGDRALQRRVEQLIANHFQAGSFLERPAVAMDPDATAGWETHVSEEGPGTVIGPYKLMEQLGEGGMGVVYVAEQAPPVRRKVALKVIKPGMDSEQVVARFDAERQALAMMDHPNIAKVYDGGTTGGRPYFVMELVRGLPITEYCDREQLSIPERLELFVLVCRAVQHAHQKGIIHRDLKPSNVLVTLHDGVPVPKVIDFGVAKALGEALTDKTIYTEFTQLVGTPLYMSPEQAELSGLDIDTRSDIYSLGVVLYELLTGTTPFDSGTLKKAAFDEMRRIICEQEPQKPSLRLSALGETPTMVSARRGADPRQLNRTVRGELDWIVMKSLEKDRRRRYETANDFAADVMRYLTGRPVEAFPPSAWYRFGKFARKHRAALATVAGFAALLVVGSVVSTVLMVRALSAERLAKQRLIDLGHANEVTTQALATTRQSEAQARAEADKAKAVNDFLTEDLLAKAGPANNAAEDHVTLLEVLDRAADKVGDRFRSQPEVEFAIRRSIAETYRGLGSMEKSERQWRALRELAQRSGADPAELYLAEGELAHVLMDQGRGHGEVLEKAQWAAEGLARTLGPDNPDTLTSRNNLAGAYLSAGRTAEAIKLYDATFKLSESKLGADHPNTLQSRDSLANAYLRAGRTAEAITMHEANVKLVESKLGQDHPNTLASRDNLARSYQATGRLADAIKLFEATLKQKESKLGPDHPDALGSRNNLATAYLDVGRTAKAIKMHEANVKLVESKLGQDHPNTLTSRNNLASAYLSAGRTAEAIKLFEVNLKLQETKLGPDHRDTLACRGNLANTLHSAGRIAEAIPLHESTVKRKESTLGPDHPDTLISRSNLANVYLDAGRTVKAIALLELTLKLQETKLGPDHPNTLHSRDSLANAYLAGGRTAEAVTMHEATLKLRKSKLGPDHPDTLKSRNNLATAYLDAGRTAEAITMHEANVKLVESKLGQDHPNTLTSRCNLAGAYLIAGRTAEAIKLFEATLKLLETKLGQDHPNALASRDNLARSYQATGRLADAIKLSEATLKQKESKLGPDHPDTLISRNNLASAYLSAGRTAEAIKLFEATLKLQETKLGQDHPNTLTTLRNLARAYQATGRLAEALPLFEDTLKRSKTKLGPDHPLSMLVMNDLATSYLDAQRWADAESMARECLELRVKKQPDDWWNFQTMSQLGAALAGQKKYGEAEASLLQGYQELKAREAKIPAPRKDSLAEAAARIMKLYEAWGKTDKAAEWRKKLETAKVP